MAQSLPAKPYLDAQGVLRGYYVYLHRTELAGRVFYVGKGVGKRAWEARSRSPEWRTVVDACGGKHQVAIVKDDLTENEAYALEAELVAQHGLSNLTNRIDGGEPGLSVGFSISLGPAWQAAGEAYEKARKFREMPRPEQEALVKAVQASLAPLMKEIDALTEHAEESDSKDLGNSAMDLDIIVGSLGDRAKEFLKRKSSWTEYGIALEEAVDDLTDDRFVASLSAGARPTLEEASKLLRDHLAAIDTGNRDEAERIASAAQRAVRGAAKPE